MRFLSENGRNRGEPTPESDGRAKIPDMTARLCWKSGVFKTVSRRLYRKAFGPDDKREEPPALLPFAEDEGFPMVRRYSFVES